MDHVDKILAQWRAERPDLDVRAMGLFGRMARLMGHLRGAIDANLATHGLTAANFDVLATLRRAGAPYALSPGDLLATMMITSGTLTSRIDQLEKMGLVARTANPQDGRSVIVRLTPTGFDLIEVAVTSHVATQTRLVAGLAEADFASLDRLIGTYLAEFEQDQS